MGASSVTGTGVGASNKLTTTELATLANGPSIYLTGYVESEDISLSPPSTGNTIVFPKALEGSADEFVVMLTTLNGGYAYVTDTDEDDDGNFSGFSFATEAECSLMYLIAKVGIRPTV